MDLKTFFNNLESQFYDPDAEFAKLDAEVFRDKNNKIEEIRIYNHKYQQILIITRLGEIIILDINEKLMNLKDKNK